MDIEWGNPARWLILTQESYRNRYRLENHWKSVHKYAIKYSKDKIALNIFNFNLLPK